MPAWGKVAVAAGAAAAGVGLGYAGERLLFRRRLQVPAGTPAAIAWAGREREIRGPDGVRLHLVEHGPTDQHAPHPVAVFSHGFALAHPIWAEQVAALADRYRLVLYDQPGHGSSSGPRSGTYSIDLLGDALAAVLEATVDPPARAVVVGHSMGGMSALACARRHPQLLRERVGGMLLLSTSARAETEDVALSLGIQLFARAHAGVERAAGLLGHRARHLARVYRASSDLSFALTRAVGLSAGADPRHVDLTEQLVLDTDIDTLRLLTPAILSMDEDETLATLDVPTIVVVGIEDKLTPVAHARHIAAVNPDVELLELPGIGHMTPLEAAATVNALIVRLLSAPRAAVPAGRSRASG